MRTVPRGIIIIELASSFLLSGLQMRHLYKNLVSSCPNIGAVPRVTGRFEVRFVEKKPVGATPADANIRAHEDRAQKL